MAIAGLHNIPAIEGTILRESQPSSSSSGGHENQRRLSTASIRQMWRELEDECASNRANERGRSRLQQDTSDNLSNCQEEMCRGALDENLVESENGSVGNSESQLGVLNENEDRHSMTSEQSQDLGEGERERVRQIFREWMNSGANTPRSNVPLRRRSSRAQLLGENEHERVMIVREWVQMSSGQRDSMGGNREQVDENGSQSEDFCGRQVLSRNEGQAETSHRGIRRLCGRQALLDLLVKREQERQLELQRLGETRPVSNFAHRNRIQSLLRIKCFQYMRSVEKARPSSAAETELGLLRQRQTVFVLREGFLSRLNNEAHTQARDLSEIPSNPPDHSREDQVQCGMNPDILDCANKRSEHDGDCEVGPSLIRNQQLGCSTSKTNLSELAVQVETRSGQAPENGEPSSQETATTSLSNGSLNDEISVSNPQEPSANEGTEFDSLEELHVVSAQQYDTDGEEINNLSEGAFGEGHVFGDVNGQESSVLVDGRQRRVIEYEEREWEGSVFSNQWRVDDQEEADRPNWPADVESSYGILENSGEQNDAQEDYWDQNASQETPRNWMGMLSAPRATSSGRDNTFYYSDDDNLYTMELRELLNRRTVSSLLHSGFRESLDQLIQSFLDRQTYLPDNWELYEMSAPPFASHDQEQLAIDLNMPDAGERTSHGLHRPTAARQDHRGHALHHANLSRHEIRRHPGTECENINDLRIDIARLQQRLNNMQKMLEACMDMQLELQRSVRQEVSAALNRSTNQSGLSIPPRDSLKWESVTKGICCICCESNIDSLLYRCGHTCTCTRCANVLVQGNGKCPICQAPVLEVVRAYFIQ